MDWTPGIACGSFVFGAEFTEAQRAELTLLEPSCEGADWQTYSVGEDTARVSVEDGLITSLECWTSVRYRGHELIGVSIDALCQRLGPDLHMTESSEDGYKTYEAPSLGLTAWVEGERVESVTMSAVFDADDESA